MHALLILATAYEPETIPLTFCKLHIMDTFLGGFGFFLETKRRLLISH